jgi:ABC-type proline/glycine betaine transport system substrate-binding protein
MFRLLVVTTLLSVSTAFATPEARVTMSTEYLQAVLNLAGTTPYAQMSEFLTKVLQDARPADKNGTKVSLSPATYAAIVQSLNSKKQDVMVRLLLEAIERDTQAAVDKSTAK